MPPSESLPRGDRYRQTVASHKVGAQFLREHLSLQRVAVLRVSEADRRCAEAEPPHRSSGGRAGSWWVGSTNSCHPVAFGRWAGDAAAAACCSSTPPTPRPSTPPPRRAARSREHPSRRSPHEDRLALRRGHVDLSARASRADRPALSCLRCPPAVPPAGRARSCARPASARSSWGTAAPHVRRTPRPGAACAPPP